MYNKKGDTRVFCLPKQSTKFKEVYNNLQEQLKILGGTDELLCGKYIVIIYK